MPIHDWARVPAGLFHDFHQSWSIRIKDALNAGRLPDSLSALVEQKSEAQFDRENRIVILSELRRTIAVIEIVSPSQRNNWRSQLDQFLERGIHVLVVDLFALADRDRVVASYHAGSTVGAFVEMIGVGDMMPEMPLYVADEHYVGVPLESTYEACWNASPRPLRQAVETGVLPPPFPD